MKPAAAALTAIALSACSAAAFAADAAQPGQCRDTAMDYPIVDFHAHTFNFRHLPLQGILYGWGVPDFVAAVVADMVHGMTGSIDAVGTEAFAALRTDPESPPDAAEARRMLSAASVDYYAALEESLTPPGRVRLEAQLNEYLAHELAYEQAQVAALTTGAVTPLTEYFRDLGNVDSAPGLAMLIEGPPDARLEALAGVDLGDRIRALFVKPFDLVAKAAAVARFFLTMLQAEDDVAAQLIADNCAVDYFVHYMMDLETVYADAPPLSFDAQQDVAAEIRDRFDQRLVTFSAFVPFRYDDYDLVGLKTAISKGAVGVKYYPPSGYAPSVARLPKKPGWFRGLIYQGGARKQWKRRYKPLKSEAVRENWSIEIDEPDRANEQTLEGISARFLEYAATNGIPVFAHQSPGGFDTYKGYGSKFAEPCAWLDTLDKYPGLALVLGHAGGGAWYRRDDKFIGSFAMQAYNMCVSYENVYCDFGYHEEVMQPGKRAILQRRLLDFHDAGIDAAAPAMTPQSCRAELADARYPIFDKLLYGSDWMMVVLEPRYDDLVEDFRRVMVGELAQYQQRFFSDNAIRVLNLSANSAALPAPLRLPRPD